MNRYKCLDCNNTIDTMTPKFCPNCGGRDWSFYDSGMVSLVQDEWTHRYAVCVIDENYNINWLGKDDEGWAIFSEAEEAYRFDDFRTADFNKRVAAKLATTKHHMKVMKAHIQVISK